MLGPTSRTAVRQSLKLRSGLGARFMSEGSTGAPRGGSADDAFVKRERAQEDYYVRQHEKEQLAKLRQKVKEQEKKIEQLEDKVNGTK
ncbi:LADA_0F13234g1_1 [Lachancea dasiensis]|uniref:ATPase inhibitor, mitochondrial n=1 Tax=Lachancea dasiensis TaxID=1072105 RepID=A0A1G4JN45_9SACH|nr:LADA_0F13234g1_1 [Lachancea dasiensis]